MPQVTVLGAGPAGLWTALTLAERFPGLSVTLIEREEVPGGITASFHWKDMTFDYGSHRLHPAASPGILEQIGGLLGDHLLERPRHGRIWLEGRFVSFPLRPLDLLFRLPPSFSAGVVLDGLSGLFKKAGGDTFGKVLETGLGRTVSKRFYFPYAEKLWGLQPESISPMQARKRIASSSLGKMFGKALSSLGGRKRSGGYFYYPAGGFGKIARRAAEAAVSEGVELFTGSGVDSVERSGSGSLWVIGMDDGKEIRSDFIFSTLPVTDLMTMLKPRPPDSVMKAAGELEYRSMVFCYLELEGEHYTEYDAHYFPGKDICFSRMSEPKNYSMAEEPGDRTGLCFEIPCSGRDAVWTMEDSEVAALVLDHLSRTSLPRPAVLDAAVRRKMNVYPVYGLDFEKNTGPIEEYLRSASGLVSLGRQGLFVHDNTHHTIEMGIAAAHCLGEDLSWDRDMWREYLLEFSRHVVVD